EESYGSQRDLSNRGGGQGMRETERWNRGERQVGDYGSLGGSSQGSEQGTRPTGFGAPSGKDWFSGPGPQPDRGGRFAGKGPKGWKRSDDRIREDVCERLTHHPDVDASEIEIQVHEAEVTLSGTVDDRHARRLAEDVAEGVSGVKHVHNNIRIQREQDRSQQGSGSSAQSSTGHDPANPLGLGGQRASQSQSQHQGTSTQSGPLSGQQPQNQPQHQQVNPTSSHPGQQPNYAGTGPNRTNR
ncbi:MAG TPA: BON domain-containing protein, partial [Bryobacteraceae bacterium]|nr:BON domain-containing protein [Bryobacteraceae bacterium]